MYTSCVYTECVDDGEGRCPAGGGCHDLPLPLPDVESERSAATGCGPAASKNAPGQPPQVASKGGPADAVRVATEFWTLREPRRLPGRIRLRRLRLHHPVTRWLVTPADETADHQGGLKVGRADLDELREAADEARRWDSEHVGGNWKANSVTDCLDQRAAPPPQDSFFDEIVRALSPPDSTWPTCGGKARKTAREGPLRAGAAHRGPARLPRPGPRPAGHGRPRPRHPRPAHHGPRPAPSSSSTRSPPTSTPAASPPRPRAAFPSARGGWPTAWGNPQRLPAGGLGCRDGNNRRLSLPGTGMALSAQQPSS